MRVIIHAIKMVIESTVTNFHSCFPYLFCYHLKFKFGAVAVNADHASVVLIVS